MQSDWCDWLDTVRAPLLDQYRALADATAEEGSKEQRFDRRVKRYGEWMSLAAVGRNVLGTKQDGTSGSSLGFYLEPAFFTAPAAGNTTCTSARVAIAARLEPAKNSMASRVPAERLIWILEQLNVGFPSEKFRFLSYPNESPRSGGTEIIELSRIVESPHWADPRGVWVSMFSEQPLDFSQSPPMGAMNPSAQVALQFSDRWPAFCAVVHFLRGLLTPSIRATVERNALMGFAGEYAVWKRLQFAPQKIWLGRWGRFDIKIASPSVPGFFEKHEVKSSLTDLPRAPFFTTTEINEACESARTPGSYVVDLVSLNPTLFEALYKTVSRQSQSSFTAPPAPIEWPEWLRRLSADLKLPAQQILHRKEEIEELLDKLADNAEVKPIGNPFDKPPLGGLSPIAGLLREGSVRIAMTPCGPVPSAPVPC
jgi:hypothetical protein